MSFKLTEFKYISRKWSEIEKPFYLRAINKTLYYIPDHNNLAVKDYEVWLKTPNIYDKYISLNKLGKYQEAKKLEGEMIKNYSIKATKNSGYAFENCVINSPFNSYISRVQKDWYVVARNAPHGSSYLGCVR